MQAALDAGASEARHLQQELAVAEAAAGEAAAARAALSAQLDAARRAIADKDEEIADLQAEVAGAKKEAYGLVAMQTEMGLLQAS